MLGIPTGTLIVLALLFVAIITIILIKENKQKKYPEKKMDQYPIIEVSKEQVREAIRKYSEELPKGVYRTILVKDDYSIDFEKLLPILKGIPSKPFYMSKETYDIFDETEKDIPVLMDKVQKAVDVYFKEHRKYPTLPYDPLKKVNFYLLKNEHYLDFQPEIDFYITHYDGIITHVKPEKQKNSMD